MAEDTVTRILTDDQLTDYQPWFDIQRKIRALITELETLSQHIADNDPRGTGNPRAGSARLTCGQPLCTRARILCTSQLAGAGRLLQS
jgi:hypothetical protein